MINRLIMNHSWKLIIQVYWIVLLVSFSRTVYPSAPSGTPYLSHFSPPQGYSPAITAIARDDFGNLYLAGRQGILVFDGISWELLPGIRQPASLFFDGKKKKLWIGGNGYIGFIRTSKGAQEDFQTVTQNDSLYGNFERILAFSDSLVFCSNRAVVSMQDSTRFSLLAGRQNQTFTGFLAHGDELYINIADSGLFRYSGKKLLPVPEGNRFSHDAVLFSLPFDNDRALFGTDNSFLYLFDGKTFTDYIPADEEYLFNRILTHAVLLNDSTLVLGTRNGGTLILNAHSRQTRYIINYQSGLPDNEVLSLGQSEDHALLIGHPYGFSRVDLSLPVNSYNIFPGLEGNILTLLPVKNRLVVGTSEGVFIQKQIREYEKTRIMVRVPVRITDTVTITKKPHGTVPVITQPSQKVTQQPTSSGTGHQGFFKKLFGKKTPAGKQEQKNSRITNPPLSKNTNKSTVIERKIVYRYVPKDIYKFKSISYRFVRLEDPNARCTQLIPYKNMILAATNAGLYGIEGEKAEYIFLGTQVYVIFPDPQNNSIVFCGTENGLYRLENDGKKWKTNRSFFLTDYPVYSIASNTDTLWLGSESSAFRLVLNQQDGNIKRSDEYIFPTTFPQPVTAWLFDNKVSFLMKEGWYDFDPGMQTMLLHTGNTAEQGPWLTFIHGDENIWLQGPDGWSVTGSFPGMSLPALKYLGIFDPVTGIRSDKDGNLWVIEDHKRIYNIRPGAVALPEFHVRIKESLRTKRAGTGNFFFNLLRPSGEIRVMLSAPWYLCPEKTVYQFKVTGFGNIWSDWQTGRQLVIPYLPPGDYMLYCRAKNVLGSIAEGTPQPIHIPVPYWQRWWFIASLFVVLALIVSGIVRLRIRKLEKDRQILEEKVRERTAEIRKQKEQIEKQRDEIARQKKAITDSIAYAQRIQKALLPPEHMVQKFLPEHFILFRPRDVVSGDFYWIRRSNDHIVVAAADCTGHGVPGAFMSMLGASFLNEIFNRHKVMSAPGILGQLREMVKESLHQTGRTYETKDGMDMALGIFNLRKHTLEFAGAYNPLYLIRNGKLTEYKADKMPIGVHIREDIPFTSTEIKLEDNDMIYMFSDGYIDQFGEKENKKFKSSRFKELLISIADKDAVQQREILIENLETWKGSLEQIDDILILGIRYHKEYR